MAKRAHLAGIFVLCMSSLPRAVLRTPNSHAALTIHAKLFTFTRVKRMHARMHTHTCVKFKVSGTVFIITYIQALCDISGPLFINPNPCIQIAF